MALLDVILPKMNGIELGILLRARYPNCRIVLFSGQLATADLLAATASGHTFEIVDKPVHPDVLLSLASQL